MNLIPVVNVFNGHMTVAFSSAMRLLETGRCRIVRGLDGVESGLEWVFDGYDADAVGSDATRHTSHSATFETIFSDFEDAEPGMPVMQFWKSQQSPKSVLVAR